MKDLLVIGGITPDMKAQLEGVFSMQYIDDLDDPTSWLQENGDKFEYVVTNGHDGVKKEYLEAMPNIQLISNYGVGYDAIDVLYANDKGMLVTHTPNVLNAEVATTTLMLMLTCFREFNLNEAHARSGEWERSGNAPLSRSADNRTIGIIGLGRIGQAIADKLVPFNPNILYHGRSKKEVSYEFYPNLLEMAEKSDVLICITSGGPATQHLVNKEVMEALGSDGILINVSRGSVVDETALIECLENGTLGWAGLDVFDKEPAIPEALRSHKNTVLLPHVGSGTIETRAAMGKLTVDNLLQHLKDKTVISLVPECEI